MCYFAVSTCSSSCISKCRQDAPFIISELTGEVAHLSVRTSRPINKTCLKRANLLFPLVAWIVLEYDCIVTFPRMLPFIGNRLYLHFHTYGTDVFKIHTDRL